jgi:hypothetical protein
MAFLADVGWTLPDRELQRYFADPEGTLDALRETLREKLPALGEAARRSGDIPGAMGYFNRALAYDPSDMRVVALVRGIARRRQQERTLKSVGIIAGAACLTSLAVVAALSFRRPPPAVRPEAHASLAPATPATPAVPSPVTPAPAVPDAGPREVVVAPAAPDAGPRAVLTASSRRTPTGRPRASQSAHAAPSAPVAMQAIEVTFPGCVNVEYSLSTEGQTRRWASGQRINVPVGPAVIRARSLFGDCQSRDQAVTIEVTSGVQRLRVPLRRVTPESSTASVRDASLSYN